MTEPARGAINHEVRRYAERADYDRGTIDSILDAAPICHVGFIADGHPYVIPTIHVRVGDLVVLHGSPASRMLRTLKTGAPMSLAVTILDGFVLARSVFNHSMNYRSVVMFGEAHEITDPDAKLEAMRAFTEKVLPGRWGDARTPSEKEFKGTLMLGIPIDIASAKVRSGPPVDDPADLDHPVWTGVIPIRLAAGDPIPAPDLTPGIEFPSRLASFFDD